MRERRSATGDDDGVGIGVGERTFVAARFRARSCCTRAAVTNQIARFLEQVHELLARRELHAVSESPLVLLGIHRLAGRALAILRAPIFRLIVGGRLDPIFRPLSRR